MALANINVITEDRASGGQVIDGSLRVDTGTSYTFRRSPGSDSTSQKRFTVSLWSKRAKIASGTTNNTGRQSIFYTGLSNGSGNLFGIEWRDDEIACIFNGAGSIYPQTSAKFRDASSWYHIVVAVDTDQGTDTDRCKVYVNGVQQTLTGTLPTSGFSVTNGTTSIHCVAESAGSFRSSQYLSQVYYINDQQLTPSDFGFTDPLTNTWRPKKYTGTFTGTNSFYLPLDGNSPIGQDKSGNGNDLTPANFFGSAAIDKATGALPILNTTNGGRVATVGARSDAYASNLVLALPFTDTAEYTNTINSAQANIITGFTNNGAEYAAPPTSTSLDLPYTTASALKLNNTGGTNYDYYRPTFAAGTLNFLHNQTGSGTVEFWFRHAGYNSEAVIWGTSNGSGNVGMSAYMTSQTTFAVFISKGTSGTNLGATGNISLPQNEWHHIAITKSTSEVRVYVDGVFKSNFTFTAGDASNSNSTNSYLQMGQNSGEEATRGWNDAAYYRDFRVYNTVKYASDFSIPSTDPDILPDTPSGVAGGSALTKITDGAVAFDGTGDYLSLANSTDFNLSTNDFTFQFWVYYTGSANIYTRYDYPNTKREVYCSVQSDGVLQFRVSHDGTNYNSHTAPAYSLRINAWNYVVITRVVDGSNSIYRSWVDGNLVKKTTIAETTIHYGSQTTYIGDYLPGTVNSSLNGFLSNFRLINGTALYTSDDSITVPSAPLTNVTNTKLLCCQSTTSATAAAVTPGSITANGNAAATNFNPFTTDINAVRGQESGYATLNPISEWLGAGTLSDGNLKVTTTSAGTGRATSTIRPTSGKWYCEFSVIDATRFSVGVENTNKETSAQGGGSTNSVIVFYNRSAYYNGSASGSFYLSANIANGDLIQVALDLDNTAVWIGVNGIWANGATLSEIEGGVATNSLTTFMSATSALTGDVGIFVEDNSSTGLMSATANFGQKPFKYNPPEGFKTLCLANLPRPTKAAVRPDKYFNTVLYTGTGGTKVVSGAGFQPDFVWIKNRSRANSSHVLVDAVRGATKTLSTNLTSTEVTTNGTDDFRSFDSNGFSVGDSSNYFVNSIGDTHVAWCWKAGGAAVSNTDGSITSQVSANQDAGFSIVSYTGTGNAETIGHRLGVAPSMIIEKNRDRDQNWAVYHSALGAEKALILDGTFSEQDATYYWNDTEPTSTVFSVGTWNGVSGNGEKHIAYCFAEVEGYSKFGSYIGNGSSDGPFIHLGFKPAWLLLKRTDSTSSWFMLDTTRDTYNVSENYLIADGNIAEGTYTSVDFLSNGFKPRNSSSSFNTNGATHVYAAFAEVPTNNLFGGQANAR